MPRTAIRGVEVRVSEDEDVAAIGVQAIVADLMEGEEEEVTEDVEGLEEVVAVAREAEDGEDEEGEEEEGEEET